MNRKKIKRILAHLTKAQALLDSMSEGDKEKILETYNENKNLLYCLRWGVNNADEILRDFPGRVKK
jgi:hypothetical protein